jgi:peptide/nickel transport system permease protein
MLKTLYSRLVWGLASILGILVLNFLILHMVPGDPVQAIVGEYPVPEAYIEQVRRDFGLDQPLHIQLVNYIMNVGSGNLGFSFANRADVLTLILDRARFTLLLVVPAMTISAFLGIFLALQGARKAGSLYDSVITGISLFGFSTPVFWLGQLLILLFAVNLGMLPAQGMASLRTPATGWGLIWDVARHMVLPIACLSLFFVADIARVARAGAVDALAQDYILTARAKGVKKSAVLFRHVLPNAMIPIVTVIGYNLGNALTATLILETVFGWPGLGTLFISSVATRDYPVLMGILLFASFFVIISNILTDFLYYVLDPRVREGGGRE